MTTYVFPGQGAQKIGMGKDLFEKYPEQVAQADEILGYSIETLCLEDPHKQLNLTQYTQPALYAVNALIYLERLAKGETRPDYVAGHSLGEYNALFAAGAFDFATGMKLVKKRGELMGEAGPGGMAAVMNITLRDIERILAENSLSGLDIANFNAPSQIVISGPKADIERATGPFEDAGARYVILKVTSAFHSRYMKSSRDDFAAFLSQFDIDPLSLPVIANVTARPYKNDEVKALLANQINNSVNWVDSVRYLVAKGETTFVECGPGRVLTGLIRKIQREADPMDLSEPVEAPADPSPSPAAPDAREAPSPPPPSPQPRRVAGLVTPERLGSRAFRETYGVRYAYMAGSIERGISSVDMVVALGRAGLLGTYGSGGLEVATIEAALREIRDRLGDKPFCMSLMHLISRPELEAQTVGLYIREKVSLIEAMGYLQITPSLVAYRLKGLHRDSGGKVVAPNRIIARVTRPEVATLFMSPAPEKVVARLRETGAISGEEAELAREIPMACDIVAVADCGGPTDQVVAYALTPAMLRLRDDMNSRYGYKEPIRVGCAGGIGTPEAAAASFMLGVDFVVTGSINQASVEAATSDLVKDMLTHIDVQDTTYSPAGVMFEMGARIQVLKRGVFFPARAGKLYSLYQQFHALEEIDQRHRTQLQEKYFRRSFEEIWQRQCEVIKSGEREKAERNTKYKMLLTFKWYFEHSWKLATEGVAEKKVDFQIYCGPSLGAFNQWVKDTSWAGTWRNRHTHELAENLMIETASLMNDRLRMFQGG